MKKVIINVSWDKNYGAIPANDKVVCIVTGKTLEEIKERMMFSLSRHLDSMRANGDLIPAEFVGEFELEYHLNARALLHYTDGLIPRKAIAKSANINLQQLSHYASGWRSPRPDMEQRIAEGIHRIGKQLTAISL
jgi:predicted RNase H-like HicB family nuclease